MISCFRCVRVEVPPLFLRISPSVCVEKSVLSRVEDGIGCHCDAFFPSFLRLYGRGFCQLTSLCTSPMIPWSIFSQGTCIGHPKIDKPSKNWLSGLCAAFVRPLCGRTESNSFSFRAFMNTCGRIFHLCGRTFLKIWSVSLCGRIFHLCGRTQDLCGHTQLLCGHTQGCFHPGIRLSILCGHTQDLCGHTQLLCGHTQFLCGHTQGLCGHI